MIPRPPASGQEVIKEIAETVGWGVCAEAVGKSESLIRKWSTGLASPSIEEIAVIQNLYVGKGYEPIATNLLKRLTAMPNAGPDCAQRAALEVLDKAGELGGAVRRATHPDSPGGPEITPNEAAAISKPAQALNNATHRVKRAIGP